MNADDRRDYRPGQRAAEEHEVLAPLAEVGLTKLEIRTLAKRPATRSGIARPHHASRRAWNTAAR